MRPPLLTRSHFFGVFPLLLAWLCVCLRFPFFYIYTISLLLVLLLHGRRAELTSCEWSASLYLEIFVVLAASQQPGDALTPPQSTCAQGKILCRKDRWRRLILGVNERRRRAWEQGRTRTSSRLGRMATAVIEVYDSNSFFAVFKTKLNANDDSRMTNPPHAYAQISISLRGHELNLNLIRESW